MWLNLFGIPKIAQKDPKWAQKAPKRAVLETKRCSYTSEIIVKKKLLVYVGRSQKSFETWSKPQKQSCRAQKAPNGEN